jgi:hypothetical protein
MKNLLLAALKKRSSIGILVPGIWGDLIQNLDNIEDLLHTEAHRT